MAKTGLTWVGGRSLKIAFDQLDKDVIGGVRDSILITMDGVAAETAYFMQQFIEKVPSSLVPGKKGRVDTGVMKESVEYNEYKKAGPKSWVVEAGWVNTVQDYFLTQEHGGMSSGLRTGDRYISPMHMLTAGMIHMREQLITDLSKL